MNKLSVLVALALGYASINGQTVTGRIVENGSNYGVPNVQVELFVNGNITPKTTLTNSQRVNLQEELHEP